MYFPTSPGCGEYEFASLPTGVTVLPPVVPQSEAVQICHSYDGVEPDGDHTPSTFTWTSPSTAGAPVIEGCEIAFRSTVKLDPLVPVPPAVTTDTVPDFAVVGTVTWRLVAVTLAI